MTSKKSDERERHSQATRRMAIVRRHAALVTASEEQTADAAAELGISPSRLRQLVRAWRLHGSESFAGSRPKSRTALVHDAILAAERRLDFSGILAERHAEVRRRIDLILRYLKADDQSMDALAAFAAEFGTATGAFRAAVNSWILARDPSKLPGARRGPLVRAPGRVTMDPRLEEITRGTIAEYGSSAGVTELHRRACARCSEAGLQKPSTSTVYNRLLAARRLVRDEAVDRTARLDRVRVATTELVGIKGPDLTLTLLFNSAGAIILHHLSIEPPSARSDAIVLSGWTNLRIGGRPGVLMCDAPAGVGWDALLAMLSEGGTERVAAPRRQLASARLAFAVFGNTIGGVRIRKLKASEEPSAIVEFDISRAQRCIGEAIVHHNADRDPAFFPPGLPDAMDRLGRLLEAFARS